MIVTEKKCSKCDVLLSERVNKYCGDGSDKDNPHQWEVVPGLQIVDGTVVPLEDEVKSEYLIQIFFPSFSDMPSVGHWTNTNWGGTDKEEVLARAEKISKVPHRPFSRVRVVELLAEFECDWG